jgi:hypothetical protein
MKTKLYYHEQSISSLIASICAEIPWLHQKFDSSIIKGRFPLYNFGSLYTSVVSTDKGKSCVYRRGKEGLTTQARC